jgi:hypothetical protein
MLLWGARWLAQGQQRNGTRAERALEERIVALERPCVNGRGHGVLLSKIIDLFLARVFFVDRVLRIIVMALGRCHIVSAPMVMTNTLTRIVLMRDWLRRIGMSVARRRFSVLQMILWMGAGMMSVVGRVASPVFLLMIGVMRVGIVAVERTMTLW